MTVDPPSGHGFGSPYATSRRWAHGAPRPLARSAACSRICLHNRKARRPHPQGILPWSVSEFVSESVQEPQPGVTSVPRRAPSAWRFTGRRSPRVAAPAPDLSLLYHEVLFLHLFIRLKLCFRPFEPYDTLVDHVGPIDHFEGRLHVLLGEEDGDARSLKL